VDASKLEAIRAVLGEVSTGGDVELRFRGVGFFPNEKRPRVLWAGIDAPPELAALAADKPDDWLVDSCMYLEPV